MNKPQSININNETVYCAEEIYKYDPSFFIGVARVRLIIEKKKLKDSDYLFAYKKNDIWVKSEIKYARAKLYLKEEYVVKNVPKMMDVVKQELYKYPEAPDILELEEHEKFKDKNGKTIKIEVRGERKCNECYFNIRDVSITFEMPNLNETVLRDISKYELNLHYKIFSVITKFNLKHPKSKKFVFLTYVGFQKFINVSRNNFNSKLIFTMTKWLQQFDNSKLKQYNIPNMKIVKKSKVGYVYCVTSNIINAIKIGFWTSSIDSLQQRYHTYFGNDIDLYYFYTKNPNKLEYDCHKYFDNYKITNELFNKDQLEDYINYLELNKNTPTDDEIEITSENNDIVIEYDFANSEKIHLLEKQLIEEQYKNLVKDKEIELLNYKLKNKYLKNSLFDYSIN